MLKLIENLIALRVIHTNTFTYYIYFPITEKKKHDHYYYYWVGFSLFSSGSKSFISVLFFSFFSSSNDSISLIYVLRQTLSVHTLTCMHTHTIFFLLSVLFIQKMYAENVIPDKRRWESEILKYTHSLWR